MIHNLDNINHGDNTVAEIEAPVQPRKANIKFLVQNNQKRRESALNQANSDNTPIISDS